MSSTDDRAASRPRRLKPALAIVTLIAVGSVVAGLAVRARDYRQLVDWTVAQEIPTVEVISPRPGEVGATILPGNLQAWTDAPIHARVGGYLKHWDVDLGSQVKTGDPMGEIDTPELDQQQTQARADLARAKAAARLARIGATRWNELLASHSVSRQEADEKRGQAEVADASVQAAQAALDQIVARESFKRVVAPFSGTVTARNVDVGDLINADSTGANAMFRLADTRRMRLYVDVPQSLAGSVRPGMTVSLTVPEHPGLSVPATLVGRSGAVNVRSGSQLVQFEVDNAGGMLMPGDYAEVRMPLPGDVRSMAIPATALMFRAGGAQVAIVGSDGKVVLRPIHIATDLGTTLSVDQGIAPRDRIVDHPSDSLSSGDRVSVAGGIHGKAA